MAMWAWQNALLIGLLMGLQTLAVVGEEATCLEEPSEVELLQRFRRTPLQQRSRGLATCWEGGGFRAHAAYTGVTAGLLSVLKEEQSSKKFTSLGGLFDHVETMSSVSGGSWFISELAFSSTFESIIQGIAESPEQGFNIYNEQWIARFIAGLAPPQKQLLQSLHASVLKQASVGGTRKKGWYPGWLAEIILEVGFCIGPGTWSLFVNRMLQSTANISGSVRLGSAVNAWAQRKTWLAGVSLGTPGGLGEGTCASSPTPKSCLGNLVGGDSVNIYRDTMERPSIMVRPLTLRPNPAGLRRNSASPLEVGQSPLHHCPSA
ncbi:unnamed protein product [Polarella glacialis]|uniref:PLA2c domain-containing protein n=1 Tax=Polarella glacialis TaxID=89957 RepID=A0A813G8M5_POLGL|nr:unnamed protein product [Polarella glacialis]CAE8709608.1 unnamed protein product [Polarella glacialis]